MHARVVLSLALTTCLLAAGCPGPKPQAPPATPGAAATAKPERVVFRVSKSGLGFRLSNADADADADEPRVRAKTTPLPAAEATKLLARLPALAAEDGDTKSFHFRDRSIPAPRAGKTVQESFPPPAPGPGAVSVAPGPLTVERRAPEGDVEIAPHVSVTFSQPMVAITSHGELGKDKPPVVLTPQPPGKWRWLGTQTLLFQPEDRLPMATDYTVEAPTGTRSATGGTLAAPARWTFATPAVSLKRSAPRGSSEPLEPVMFAEFDQRIDPAKMLAAIEVSGGGKTFAIRAAEVDEIDASEAVRRFSQQAEKGRWLAFKPVSKLPTETSVTVKVRAGAPSAEGPKTSTKDQTFGFTTYGPFKVTRHGCGWGHSLCRPLSPMHVSVTNPINLKTFDPSLVSITPDVPGIKVEASGRGITLRGATKGRTKYTVHLKKALGDIYDQTFDRDLALDFDVGPAEPQLFSASDDMVVLDPAGPRAYPVYSVNEPSLRVRLHAVGPSDWAKYRAWHEHSDETKRPPLPGRVVFDKVIRPAKRPDELVTTMVDLKPLLTGLHGHGVVHVESTRPVKHAWERGELITWVQSTELGLDAWHETDRVTGWTTRLSDGASVEGVDVELLGAGASKTDKDGVARVSLTDKPGSLLVAKKGTDRVFLPQSRWGTDDFERRRESDALRWLVFDDRGTYKPGEEVHVKGWIRRAVAGRGGDVLGLANPTGVTASFVVKDARWAEIGKGSARLDASGGFDFAFKLPGNANLGRATFQLSLSGASDVTRTDHSHQISVQEFRRPEFEVTARASEGPHFVGKHAVATVAATYYAGGGLPNAPVQWQVTRSTVPFTPPGRADFHFGPEPGFQWRMTRMSSYLAASGEVDATATKTETWTSHTNAKGAHRLRVDFDALEPPFPMQLALTAQVEDLNHQQWAGRTRFIVHPGAAYVGLKMDKAFLTAGEATNVDVVVTDIDGAAVPGRVVEVRAARIDWEQRGTDYVEVEKDEQRCSVTSAAEAVRCTLPNAKGGKYKLSAIVADEHGRKNKTELAYWVTGANAPKDRSLSAEQARVVSDKAEHAPGETASVLVVSPFAPAEGVLTLERQGVVHLERFHMDTTTHTLRVKLEDAHMPTVHARVLLVGAAARLDDAGNVDATLAKRPAYATGDVALGVSTSSRKLDVKVLPAAATLAPGGATRVAVEIKDSAGRAMQGASVTVYAADEAVLALGPYATPDAMAAFYGARARGVTSFSSRSHVMLAEPDLAKLGGQTASGFGAGGMGVRAGAVRATMAPGKAMAPPAASAAPVVMAKRKIMINEVAISGDNESAGGEAPDDATPITERKDFAPLALFSPRVTTDASGRAEVALKLPDNLTRYRVMAVAVHAERQFGSGEATVTARLPLMVRPSPPRFLNFGDRFELPVVLQNQTDKPMDVAVVVRATNARVTGGPGQRVSVAANDRAELRFAMAADKPGTARVQFGVSAPGVSDATKVELPVYTPATTEAFATYGEIDQGAIAQPVKMPSGVVTEFGGLEITTSSTALQALTDAVLYLVRYPFECNEQRASRVVAIAALRDVLSAFEADGLPSKAKLAESVAKDIQALKVRQHYDGGWGFWRGASWPYLTIHVTHALVRAKQKGYAVDSEILFRAQRYLRDVERHIPSWYGIDARRSLIAYALSVRALNKDADPPRARALIREAGGVDKLPMEAVGWIWPTIGADKASATELEEIRRVVKNRVTETSGMAHFVTGYKDGDWVMLHSDRRADGVLLDALIGDEPTSTLIPKIAKGLLGHRKAGRWTNTQENAFVLLALDRYFQTYEKATPDFVARVWLGGKFAGEQTFKGRSTDRRRIDVPMSVVADVKQGDLVLSKDGPGRLYYRVGMQYAPSDLRPPPSDHGFVVSRIYEAVDKPDDVKREADGTWRMKLGAKVRVRVTMVARARRYHVALVDPLPAGLEPMNAALAVTGDIPKDPKETARKGRYWFWSRSWYEHQNMRDERVEAFTSLLWDGVHEYVYVARATTPGTFVAPPPKAEEMYAPETFGRGGGDKVVIED
jgi:alpha-2-macroglobulin